VQTSHALLVIRTMASETVVRQDRPNLPIKDNSGWRGTRTISGNGKENANKACETQIQNSSFSEYIVNQ
jgi:hypothetical protein